MELKAHFCVYKSRNCASWIQSTTSHTNSFSFIAIILFLIFQTGISLCISHLSVHIIHPVSSLIFLPGRNSPSGPWPPHYRGFTITLRHTILGRTPLDEWSACRTDLYLTSPNNHKRETSMPLRDSKPQSQQASSRRPTPYTARPLRSAILNLIISTTSGKE